MKQFSENLQQYLKTDIDLYRFSNTLMDEEYMDKNRIPLMCQYCNSENLTKHRKVDFDTLPENYQKQILDIYPDLDSSIITFWTCDECDSIVALKLYSHKNHQEKKIYYHKYDSFHQIIKDLKKKGYLESGNEPCQCWYCQSDKIEIKNEKDRGVAICQDCKKVLGYAYNNSWRIVVENDE